MKKSGVGKVMWCEKRLREKIICLRKNKIAFTKWTKLEEESINSSATFLNSSSSFPRINYFFSPRILIFLNAKNQTKKSGISIDNQQVDCFWFFWRIIFPFSKKNPPNTWLRIFNIVFLPTETQKNIFGDYLKISQNNPWKTWQPLFKCGIFANGKTNHP